MPSPTNKLLPIPTPPDTINAPVEVEVEAVVSVTLKAPDQPPLKLSAVTIPLETTSVRLDIPLTVNFPPSTKSPPEALDIGFAKLNAYKKQLQVYFHFLQQQ